MSEAIRCTCERLNDPWRRYCGRCGNALGTSCRCGFPNSEDDRYCGGCGVTVSRRPGAALPGVLRLPPPTIYSDHHEEMRTVRIEPRVSAASTQRMDIAAPTPVLDTSTQQIEMLCDTIALDPNT